MVCQVYNKVYTAMLYRKIGDPHLGLTVWAAFPADCTQCAESTKLCLVQDTVVSCG